MKIFMLKDNVSEKWINDLILAENGKTAVRRTLNQVLQNFTLRDVNLYMIGKIDENADIISCQPQLIPWTEYKFPETKAEALEPLGVTEEFKKILEAQKDNNDEIYGGRDAMTKTLDKSEKNDK